jgi:hypothetical protein
VLNGTQILSGYIGKIGNKITISISLFTFPDLEQLPGGVDLDVANKDELFDKIPELVRRMQSAIDNGSRSTNSGGSTTAPDQTRKKTQNTFWNSIVNDANRNYLELISGYIQIGDDLTGYGGSFLVGGHISPFPFASFGLETRLGKLNDEFYGSASPMFGLVIPFNKTVKLYGDAIIELGHFGSLEGRINNWVTPAFDAGMLFWFDGLGFDFKYRGTWYEDNYIHSFGIGLLTHPKKFSSSVNNSFYSIGSFFSGIGSLFNDWKFFNGLFMLGYTYTPDLPVGFSFSFLGLYSSFNFGIPNWKGYKEGKYNNQSIKADYYSDPFTETTHEKIDWTIGYNITIIPNILYLPIGGGVAKIKEWRLQYYSYNNKDNGYEWNHPRGDDDYAQSEHYGIFELGLLLKLPNDFSPYISGTYRYKGTGDHYFLVSAGICFDLLP